MAPTVNKEVGSRRAARPFRRASKLAAAATVLGSMTLMGSVLEIASSASASASSSPFNVLMIGGLSGTDASSAIPADHGMTAAVEYLNRHGGILGHHVALTVDNDTGKATNAVSDLEQYLSSGKTPNLVWPGSSSTTGVAIAPTLTRDHILANGVVGSTAVVAPKVNPYFFNVSGLDSTQGVDAAKYFKSKGYKKVGVLYENFILGVEDDDAESAALRAQGITVSNVSFPPTSLNLTPEVETLKNDGVQAVLIDGLGQPVGLALTARTTLGWSVPVVGDELSTTFDPTGVRKTILKGVDWEVPTVDVYRANESAAFDNFYNLTRKLGAVSGSLFNYASGWDVVMLADYAAQKANSISGPKLAAELQHLPRIAHPNYVLVTYETYSAKTHFLHVPLSIVPMKGSVGGMYNVPSGAKLP